VLRPPRVPQCNAFAERFVRSIKQECLSRLLFLSEQHLRATLSILAKYYQHRRNHQGIENKLIEPLEPPERLPTVGRIRCQQELGGRLNYYYREAARFTSFCPRRSLLAVQEQGQRIHRQIIQDWKSDG